MRYLFVFAFILLSVTLNAQKSYDIIDIFFEALQKDSTEIFEIGQDGAVEITIPKFNDEHNGQGMFTISPSLIINKYPEAHKYLINDSTFRIRCSLSIIGRINDDLQDKDSDTKIKIENIHFNDLVLNINIYSSWKSEVFNESLFSFENTQIETLQLQSTNMNFDFKKTIINGLFFWTIDAPFFTIDNSEINQIGIIDSFFKGLKILNSTINYLSIQQTEMRSFTIDNCKFNPIYYEHSLVNRLFLPEAFELITVNDSTSFFRENILGNICLEIGDANTWFYTFTVTNNHFETNNQNPVISFEQYSDFMIMENNQFDAQVELGSIINNFLSMNNNQFSSISFNGSLPETPTNIVHINWQDIKNKIVWKTNVWEPVYKGENQHEIANESLFFKLISSYNRLVNIYRDNGNIKSANDCYLDMKELQLIRYKYEYETEGGFTNFFRLKLNQLLSIYTKHGTDPAQAISASVYIILLFSIIYFFYPSEWDTDSKERIIGNFKKFIKKDDHGYIKPFFVMIGGLMLSLLNAITLSVNSFITLGFGTIPTKGAAKYICIFQGFMGWFLLSIFIVSLINQVLI